MTKKRIKSLDEYHMGPEPTWDDVDELIPDPELEHKIEEALRWYQHFHDFKASLDHVRAYYKKNHVDRTNLKQIGPNDLMAVGRTPGFLCRMKLRGLPRLPIKFDDILIARLKKIEELGKERTIIFASQDPAANANVISIQDRIQQIAKSLIFDIDYVLELFEDNNFKTSFEFTTFAELNTIKKPTASKLIPLLQERVDELENKENDPDLKEGYRHLTKRQKNKIIKLLNECIGGCRKIVLTSTRKKHKKIK